eukprot:Gb_27505 [translate_table: standard]
MGSGRSRRSMAPFLRSEYMLMVVCPIILVAFSSTQQIVVAARHDPADHVDGHGDANNLTMYNAEDVKTDIVDSLQTIMELLQRASKMNETIGHGGQCGLSINSALSSAPLVQNLVLNDSYAHAIGHLNHVKQALSSCDEIYIPDYVDVSEGMLDFTNQASKHADMANALLLDLQDLKKERILFSQGLTANYNRFTTTGIGKRCGSVDGTKCQFSDCGKGKQLPNCAIGFASGVIGGAKGESYIVTSAEDNPQSPPPGTLRYAVELAASHPKGVWITFSHDMIINLREMLWLKSHTTIDGRGVNVTITGKNIVLARIHNVILHNFQINAIHESDTVHIFSGTTKVWVDHLTSFDGKLGLVSVVQGSTDVTISNSYLSNYNFNMLLGASDTDTMDQKLRVTVYRNWFKDSRQRMPHCRWGYCHVVNNLYSNWGYYAIGARVHAKVFSEKNVFQPGKKHEITPWFRGSGSSLDTTSTIQSSNDLLLNGATFHQFLRFGSLAAPHYRESTDYPPIRSTATLPHLVQSCAGALFGPKLDQCLHA